MCTSAEEYSKLHFALNDDISGTENRIDMKQKPFSGERFNFQDSNNLYCNLMS